MKSRWMLVLILVVLLFAGCGKNSDEDKGTLTPTGAGKATATPAITPAEMTLTPTPSAEPTATPTPTIAIPGRPEEYQVKALIQAVEDEIEGYQYAYREVTTFGSPTEESVYFYWRGALGRNTRASDPWELSNVTQSDYDTTFVFNSSVAYLDDDLNCLKRRFLLNDKETAVWYSTSLGDIFTYPDGTVLYNFQFEKYDDAGHLLFDLRGYNDYDCYAYDEAGRLSVKARYSPENSSDMMAEMLDSYDRYTYDDAGRLLREETYNAEEETNYKPVLRICREYTYDESGNCISVTYEDTTPEQWFAYEEYGTENGRYDFVYEKDGQGRLRSRKRLRYSPEGELMEEKTIEFVYYADGSVLMMEQAAEDLVIYPDTVMAESLRSCTNLTPIYSLLEVKEKGSVDYRYYGYPEVDDNRDAIGRYQDIPVTKMPETRPLVVYYTWYTDHRDSLLQMQSFDYRKIDIDDKTPIPYLLGYRDGRLEKTVYYEGGGGGTSQFEYDSEHRLIAFEWDAMRTEYRYDANGRPIEIVMNSKPSYADGTRNSLARYVYNDDGRLIEASIIESYQNPYEKMVAKTTTFLFEYSGDGTD